MAIRAGRCLGEELNNILNPALVAEAKPVDLPGLKTAA